MATTGKWIPTLIVTICLLALNINAETCYQTPINIALNYQVGTIIIKPILEIFFDLQINAECLGYCHIFSIQDRYPLIYTHGNLFIIEYRYNSGVYGGSSADAYSLIIDGSVHQLYIKLSENERTVIIDNIVFISDIGPETHQAVNQQKSVTAAYAVAPATFYNGIIYNLCIKSLDPTNNPSVSPSLYPTQTPSKVTVTPTLNPTLNPTVSPSLYPTQTPSKSPSFNPSVNPTLNPSFNPSILPSYNPTKNPTLTPTFNEHVVIDIDTTSSNINTSIYVKQNSKNNDSWVTGVVGITVVIIVLIVILIILIIVIFIKKRQQKHKQHIEMSANIGEKMNKNIGKQNAANNTIVSNSNDLTKQYTNEDNNVTDDGFKHDDKHEGSLKMLDSNLRKIHSDSSDSELIYNSAQTKNATTTITTGASEQTTV